MLLHDLVAALIHQSLSGPTDLRLCLKELMMASPLVSGSLRDMLSIVEFLLVREHDGQLLYIVSTLTFALSINQKRQLAYLRQVMRSTKESSKTIDKLSLSMSTLLKQLIQTEEKTGIQFNFRRFAHSYPKPLGNKMKITALLVTSDVLIFKPNVRTSKICT
jgi:hypothetical protein